MLFEVTVSLNDLYHGKLGNISKDGQRLTFCLNKVTVSLHRSLESIYLAGWYTEELFKKNIYACVMCSILGNISAYDLTDVNGARPFCTKLHTVLIISYTFKTDMSNCCL